MEQLLDRLRADYPSLTFCLGASFYWSPAEQIVYYTESARRSAPWTLLHETSHGILKHTSFTNDMELVQLEVAAWQKAKELAATYDITIDTNHIEDCLDTYRDWVHKRSLCPDCGIQSLQVDTTLYGCLNCNTSWHVSQNRLCRPYRRKQFTGTSATI